MMAAVSISETSVNFGHTTPRNKPEDGHLHTLMSIVKMANFLSF
jgi:hypothetical protein